MPELLLRCALRCSHSRLFWAPRCCLPLLQVCLLFNHLSSSDVLPFSTGFCHFCIFHTSLSRIFILGFHLFFFINSLAFPYCISFLLAVEASGRNVVNSTVCCSSVCCPLNYYTSILFVLHKRRKFFSVAHFGAAIVVFSARFGAAFCCFNFPFCLSSYVRPLSHISLLGLSLSYFSYFAVSYFS